MGIFNFYSWFRKQYSDNIYKIKDSILEVNSELSIDNLMIDCNGLFHMSAQKVFKYGNFKPSYKVLIKENRITQQQVFKDVCESIEDILITINPTKRLILCVDGSAPCSKQAQQRKRRFKAVASKEEDDKSFDSNQLSPGTAFMEYLSKYIDWFIRKRLSENPLWQNLEIIYSSCNVPSEGEQKLLSYIRKYGKNNESFMIHGLDADLIMLSLLTHFPKMYVLRDDTYDRYNKYLLLDIGSVRNKLIEKMKWTCETQHCLEDSLINDFVFLAFLCGNDFLPHIPAIEIIEGGIEVIMSVCKTVGEKYGHITRNNNGNIVFCIKSLKYFLEIISESEKELLEQKHKNRAQYFPDDVLDSSVSFNGESYELDIEMFREKYNEKYFSEDDIEKVCHMYLGGLQWVLSYYTKEVPSWRWFYPYHYAPLSSSLFKYIDTYEKPRFHKGLPYPPFLQLMSILPPKSSELLPKAMTNVLRLPVMKKYCPDEVEVDLSGKRQEYQGIVLLPFTEYNVLKKVYDVYIEKVDEKEIKRNIFSKSLIYRYNPEMRRVFYSFYGNILECMVEFKTIDL